MKCSPLFTISISSPLHWRFYGCEDFTLRKNALYPLSHTVHTRYLLVFFVVIENGQTLCPLHLEGWETPAGLCQTHLSCPRQKMCKSQRQMETFLKYIGVPVNFPQGLPCGRLKPVWSDLHPCSFLTRPELMSCAPSCPAWRALSRSFTSALIPPFPQFHSPAPASAPLWSAPRSERLIWTSGTNRFRTQIVFRNKFESSKTTQSTQKLILL